MGFLAYRMRKGGTAGRASRRGLSRFRHLAVPERLEDRATPGGSLLELLLGVPLATPFLDSTWGDGNPSGIDETPEDARAKRARFSDVTELRWNGETRMDLLGEIRGLMTISSAAERGSEQNVPEGRACGLALADSAWDFDSDDLSSDDWWADGAAGALGRGLAGPGHELPVEGDPSADGWVALMGYGYGNRPPVAVNDSGYYPRHDQVLQIPASGVLANDYDPDPGTGLDYRRSTVRGHRRGQRQQRNG